MADVVFTVCFKFIYRIQNKVFSLLKGQKV